MTATATTATTTNTSDTWSAQLEQLKVRYRHLRPAVLAALNILVNDKDVTDDDAKAQANLHGVRITAASLNAARTVLARMDALPTATAMPKAPVAPARTREPRRRRAPDAPLDAEALIKNVVGKIQSQGAAEAERLRDAMRKAIAVLQAAVGRSS